MTKDEALMLALDFIEETDCGTADLEAQIKEALAQPVQKPVECRFCFSKKGCWTWQCYHCGEIDDVQKPPLPVPVQEPVAWMVYTQEGQSAFVTDNPSQIHPSQRALPLYATPPLPVPVQEPVTWDKPSASFNEWWDSDRRRDNANPFQTGSFAYWAFEGWQAARLKEKNND